VSIRNPTSWPALKQTLDELFAFKDQYTGQNLDFHGRKIQNASPSELDYDYVVRKELKDLVGGGLSQPPVAPKSSGSVKTYDKITFGIGIGAAVAVGSDLTPPYIWSNIASGRPDIILVTANTPPTGDDLDFDIKKNGSSIFTSGKFTLPAGTGSKVVISSTSAFITNISFSRPAVFSVDVSKIGSTLPGQGIEIVIYCRLI
jgi:hypothetical protein